MPATTEATTDDVTTDDVTTRPDIRSLDDVARATPGDLAMMSGEQVDALADDARQLRVARIEADTDTTWDIYEVAAYARKSWRTVVKWRNRQLQNSHGDGRWMYMPPALPERRTRPSGPSSPQWLMIEVLRHFRKMNACDRRDYVAFPGGRKPPGWHTTPPAAAPAQRTRR